MAAAETIFGRHTVEHFLRRNPERVLSLEVKKGSRDTRLEQLIALATELGISVVEVPMKTLDGYARNHQGVVARVRPSRGLDEQDLEGLIEGTAAPLFLVLDRVQDPHNLGACLRSAEAAGVTAVISTRNQSSGITPVVRKVACGAAELVPFVQVANLARCLAFLKTHNVWCVGLCEEAEESLFEVKLLDPAALVLGGEGPGLRHLTKQRCDQLVRLPMAGSVESLNVSVASGICLFEVVRQRSR